MSAMEIIDPQDLVVSLDLGWCAYFGTRAQLEEEGLIPDGMQWPNGYSQRYWSAGPFRFALFRRRPEGAKGPRRQFLEIDWWQLSWGYSDPGARADVAVRHKSEELAKLIRRNSPDGQAELNRHCAHCLAARRDTQFQAFKALIPGLVPPPRRRSRFAAEGSATHEGGRS